VNYLSVYLVLKYTVKLPLIWTSNSELLTLVAIFICVPSWNEEK